MTDNEARLALRPQLHLAPAPQCCGIVTSAPDEAFQNDTLRPIMKMQHELLRAAFFHFLRKRKVKLEQLAERARFEKVKELVTRDNRLRGLLFGVAVGQFTDAEMDYYLANESAVNRRMTNLLTERLASVV